MTFCANLCHIFSREHLRGQLRAKKNLIFAILCAGNQQPLRAGSLFSKKKEGAYA
jgi:hypothetical protein